MKLIVDRIEGDMAVCEQPGRSVTEIPLSQLPKGVREGDCLRFADGVYHQDPEETARRRAQSRALFQKLMKKDSDPSS